MFPPRTGAPIYCQYCPGQDFRRSRLRSDDMRNLLLMRYPVRCLRCGQRQIVSFTVAALSLPSSARQPKPQRRGREKNWTEPQERMVLKIPPTEPPRES